MAGIAFRLLLCAGFACTLAGCREVEPIRTYNALKVRTPPPRLLAAIVPATDKIWFFKLAGAEPAVTAQMPAFQKFVESLSFTNSKESPATWTLPNGWRESEGRSQMRFATLRAGPEALEVTITPLGEESGALLPNINRWRGQIGLKSIGDEAELQPPARRLTIDGKTVTMIDMTGALATPAAMSPQHPPIASRPPDRNLKYTVPTGWTEQPVKGIRAASFSVREGDVTAEITVIPLAGPAGGLLANVNRWRKEVGLDDTTDAKLAADSKKLDLGGVPAVIVDLPGKTERTLGAIFAQGERTWFVKFRGPSALVEKQKANFEAFVQSLRIASSELLSSTPSGGGS